MLKIIKTLFKPKGNPMCKDCGFFKACKKCAKAYDEIENKILKKEMREKNE